MNVFSIIFLILALAYTFSLIKDFVRIIVDEYQEEHTRMIYPLIFWVLFYITHNWT